MSSYISVILDTTAPKITINLPNYTIQTSTTFITIAGNEILSNYQEFYAIDSTGARFNYTFSFDSISTFHGQVKFSDLAIGKATFYARVMDTVNNVSLLTSKEFEINESIKVNIQISDQNLWNITVSEKML